MSCERIAGEMEGKKWFCKMVLCRDGRDSAAAYKPIQVLLLPLPLTSNPGKIGYVMLLRSLLPREIGFEKKKKKSKKETL